jgi:hypothetical protein
MMTAQVTPYHGLFRRYPKTKSMLNTMSPCPPSRSSALFAKDHSNVYKSGTDISNHTSHIRFIAHHRVVLGPAVVDVT